MKKAQIPQLDRDLIRQIVGSTKIVMNKVGSTTSCRAITEFGHVLSAKGDSSCLQDGEREEAGRIIACSRIDVSDELLGAESYTLRKMMHHADYYIRLAAYSAADSLGRDRADMLETVRLVLRGESVIDKDAEKVINAALGVYEMMYPGMIAYWASPESPKRVFLGGTVNANWREVLIRLLRIDYFNPIVEDWTEDCIAEETRQRSSCDYVLCCITPQMSGVYSVAEIVETAIKRSEAAVLTLLEEFEGHKFSPSDWKSLKALALMVKSNGGNVFYTLADTAAYLNSK